jgi:hypothetical protein
MLDLAGACVGCDQWHTLDDLGMCDFCAAKFDRDLLRQRAWDYLATAFGCAPPGLRSTAAVGYRQLRRGL